MNASAAQAVQQKNARMARLLFVFVGAMVGLAYVSVPLYGLFCKATGFGGTTQVATSLPSVVMARSVTVRFNADVSPELPWTFRPERPLTDIKIGQVQRVTFFAKNNGAHDTHGIAVFNVQPERAGLYFNKVQCFCFDDKPLKAGETAELPVQFFIDPAIAKDPLMDEVKSITLSYTFFSSKSPKLVAAQKKFDTDQQRLLDIAPSTP